MAVKRETVSKSRSRTKPEAVGGSKVDYASKDELKGDLDDLLDEIDGVLEENAEEFVKAYVQKGGE